MSVAIQYGILRMNMEHTLNLTVHIACELEYV